MSTGAKCGYSGTVSLGGEITRWNIIELVDTPDATSMDSADTYREYIACLKSLEGSFDTQTACGGTGSQLGVTFQNDLISYTFDLFITDVKNAVPVGDKIAFTYNFISTGAVVIA